MRPKPDAGRSPIVSLTLLGREVYAAAQVLETGDAVAKALMQYLSHVPKQARYFRVKLDEAGNPLMSDVQAAAQERVVVRFTIQQS